MSAIFLIFLFVAEVPGTEIWEEFSGVKWGSPLASLKGLQKTHTDAYVQYFVRPEEVYALDDLVLGKVTYGFYLEKFYAAFIDIDTRAKFDRTMELLQLKYGKPRANLSLNQTVYIWDYQQVKIKLKQDNPNQAFKLGYYYTPLSEALNQQRIAKDGIKIRKLED